MRPMLLPALRRLWRDERTLQLGVDPRRAVVLDGVTPPIAVVLDLLDGQHQVEAVVNEAAAAGVDQRTVEALLTSLADYGALVDAATDGYQGEHVRSPRAAHLTSEFAALTLTLPQPDLATGVLRRRADTAVVVHGQCRSGPVVAALFAAAGIGRVHVATSGVVGIDDSAVGGVLPADMHRPRAVAAAEAALRAAPAVDTRPLGPGHDPDLVVLVDSPPGQAAGSIGQPPGGSALRWAIRRIPHLPLWVRDAVAVIGPLILPGHTACLNCLDLHRSDRDPAWPALAAQLATSRGGAGSAAGGALLTGASALAVMQALAYLDGSTPETLGGSLELTAPGDVVRRRSWSPHPNCGCLDALPPTASSSSPPGPSSRRDAPTAATMAG